MHSPSTWRLRARAALERYFRSHSFPRFTLSVVVALAGVAGLLVSQILLKLGMQEMWQRYPLAVLGGYLAFLTLIRIWVEIELSRYDPNNVDISDEVGKGTKPIANNSDLPGSDRSWLDWLDVPGSLDFDEGCFIGCAVALVAGIVLGAATSIFSFVMAGSELLAEVFLDAVLISVFYRHLKNAAKEHWLGTAVKRTWVSALLTALAVSLIGAVLDIMAPGSHAIGPAIREIFNN
jgi:hypothetical protein